MTHELTAEAERAVDSILEELDEMAGIGGSANWTPSMRSLLGVLIDTLLLR